MSPSHRILQWVHVINYDMQISRWAADNFSQHLSRYIIDIGILDNSYIDQVWMPMVKEVRKVRMHVSEKKH